MVQAEALWFANNSKYIHSIETNKVWYDKIISEYLSKNNLKIYFCEEILENYLKLLDSFESRKFDYILVDGKFRDHTALRSIKILKNKGFLIIDNINRYIPSFSKSPTSIRHLSETTKEWKEFINQTKNFKKYVFTNNITDTGIFIKNK